MGPVFDFTGNPRSLKTWWSVWVFQALGALGDSRGDSAGMRSSLCESAGSLRRM